MRIVIVGGGCSGVMCAIHSKNDDNEVIILERGEKLLKKLLLTGNGRCNYFNENQDICKYHSSSLLIDKFVTEENVKKVINYFNEVGIIPKIKNGYYYPYSNQASTIYDVLVSEVNRCGVLVYNNYLVTDIKLNGNGFIINDDIYCDKLVLATGSFSYPKTGSDGMGYGFLEKLGHRIVPVLPSLVQLKSNMKYCSELDGVRSDVLLSLYVDREFIKSEAGEVQLTSYGISGICTFNLSYYVSRALFNNKKCFILVNFVPFIDDVSLWFEEYRKRIGNVSIYSLLCRILNKKIVAVILKMSCIGKDVFYEMLTSREKDILFKNLCSFEYEITGTLGYEMSQVCSGGVALEEVNYNDFSSLIVDGVYILGELIDICGDCGGYNLTTCFMSGILAGRSLGDLCD